MRDTIGLILLLLFLGLAFFPETVGENVARIIHGFEAYQPAKGGE